MLKNHTSLHNQLSHQHFLNDWTDPNQH